MKIPRLRFRGAAQSVTGSCFELETETSRILIDCGMFQGSKSERELNYGAFPFSPDGVDAVILTHAHIDHSGLLPKLVKHGFGGPIHATPPTVDLCSVMLPDSAHIQEMEVENLNRRNEKRGRELVEPIYDKEDAAACMTQFRPADYDEWINVSDDIRARFWNAGHLLGSASVELEVGAMDVAKPMRLLFSGDLGPQHKLLQPDPRAPSDLDYLVCESTYGDRERGEITPESRRSLLQAEVRRAAEKRGPLIIPSFAVERTQELLVDIHRLMLSGAVPPAPIIVDSPLATRASAIFERHAGEIDEGAALVKALNSGDIRFTETVEQSKAVNRLGGFFIIIAASGMCDAGRIRHHLKNNLWRRNATVMLVGFQAQGSLGRILLDGAQRVRIQGEEIEVKASIRQLDLYSGHADATELVNWVNERLPVSRGVFLSHGEAAAMGALKSRLGKLVAPDRILMPEIDEGFDLGDDRARHAEEAIVQRLQPERVAHLDWHNDLSKLLLDVNDAIAKEADEQGRQKIIRKLRRALAGDLN